LDLPDAMTLVTPAEGPIEAALCLGKGLDYQGMVSDWCGDPTRLPGLLKRVMDHLGLAATVIFAATRNEAFRRALQPHASAEVLTPLAMVKSFGEVDVATLFDEQGIHVPGLDAS
ncbi:MAG: hypothetical protein KDB53_18850, partial [Planctomycetes bacterium]|nr:hypothetical protein [Planctomycetota bacterium]